MERQRIQVYADPEMKRRIELVAAKHNVAVTEYCLDAIRQRLADDEMLDASEVTIAINPTEARRHSWPICARCEKRFWQIEKVGS